MQALTDFLHNSILNSKIVEYYGNEEISALLDALLCERNYLISIVDAEIRSFYEESLSHLLTDNEKLAKQLVSALNSTDCAMLDCDLPTEKEKDKYVS